jgi:hypothetical protein
MRFRLTLLLSLMIFGLLAQPARPSYADAYAGRGYLWSLAFDFENSFDGLLTIKVGPWENGNLVSVEETSTTVVACQRVGAVILNGGAAVFEGGHLACDMDLAAIVKRNHGIIAGATDSYGSFVVRASLASSGQNLAPIFTHPDVSTQIDFTQTSSVTLAQSLATSAGPAQASAFFPGLLGGDLRTYSFLYGCGGAAACSSSLSAGPQTQAAPVAGDRVSFRTGPTTFLIGGDGAATFVGGLGGLVVDPGNSFP